MFIGKRIGLVPTRIKKIIDKSVSNRIKIDQIIENSFLSETCKKRYLESVKNRLERLRF